MGISVQKSAPFCPYSEGTTVDFSRGFPPRNPIPLPGVLQTSMTNDQEHAPDDLAHFPDNDRTYDPTNEGNFFGHLSGHMSGQHQGHVPGSRGQVCGH